ncbi:MAG: iron-siderophore ABC transporter substrate-binding protein [Meiothermus sp.]|nr:iron-siderophore ABC transporter substrate-binding protein [Meiothermus sp.]
MKRVFGLVWMVLASLALAQAQPCAGRLVQHALGTTCVVGTPKRVVALEWTYVETLLILGVQPVGVADIKGYQEWVRIPIALDKNVVDVGTRAQPSLEVLTTLKPDLILAPAFRVQQIYPRLAQIAPTLTFDPFTEGGNQYAEMVRTFQTIAEVMGRSTQARTALTRMETRFAQARQTLQKAELFGQRFVLAQAFTSRQNLATMRLFTRNSLVSQVLEQIGLKNAWGDRPQPYGYTEVGLEALSQLKTDHFFYIVQENDNVFAGSSVEALWKNLDFVRSHRAYRLPGNTWTFGGPLSAEGLVGAVVGAMTRR